ncbi:MAG: GNAT family N-acetyltransferase [Planctomycetes bacterium]|nr:GNAT family N-acetyltransferase [Planctomycetota bacterium]
MVPAASFRVRLASAADVDAFVAQRLELFAEAHGLDVGPERERLAAGNRAAFASLVGGPGTWVWLAEERGGAVVGSAALHSFARFPSHSNPCAAEGYVSHVYVAPAHRRRGIGSALVDAIASQARREGLFRVRLHATEPGRALYETCGFRLRSNDMELRL